MQTQPLYLNGQWVNEGKPIEVENPATGQMIGQVATVNRQRVYQAIVDANSALNSWRTTTAKERGRYLLKMADYIEAHAESIATIMTKENGKPLVESRGEIAGAVDHLQWFAHQGRRVYGRVVPQQIEGKRHLVLKSPVGVAGAISPWNFPLILAVRKAAPALAAGCPVILKPASQTPLCALELAKAAQAAGLPKAVFQVVLGDAGQIGQEMLENPLCRKISFTGSTQVGKLLIKGAAETTTRLSLELGGQAPALVFDDCDFEVAIDGVLAAKFRNTGQSCIAANRIFVQRGIYEKFVNALAKRIGAMKAGNGLEEDSDIGPLIDKKGVDKVLAHIEDAKKRSAKVLAGGEKIKGAGYFIQPTVLVDVDEKSLCMREETFGPVAAIAPFEDESQAVQMANDTPFGLSAYVFTRDLSRTWRLAENLEAGTIGINDGVPSTTNCPFGGVKESGWGRELGEEGIEAFLETKHVSIAI